MPASRFSPFAALRHRNYRLFYTGQAVSLVGTWMQGLAQGWLVLQLTNSALWVGLVGFLNSVPILLFSLPAGVYVDRADKRRIALNSSAFNAARIVGPALAGVIVARVGLTACFALNAASYVPVLLALRRMRMPPRPPPPVQGDALAGLREGLRYVRGEPRVLALIVATGVLSLLAFPYVVLLPVFARDVFGVGAEGLGAMSAAIGVGAVASALGLAALGARAPRGRLVAWASASFGLAVAAFAFAPWFPLAVVVLGVTGFAMVLNNAATNTLLQNLVPDALRGRVMALWSLVFMGFGPLGSLQAGWLAGHLGPRAAVALGAALATLTVLWIWRRLAPQVTQLR